MVIKAMLNPRHLAAPLWLAAWRAGRALFPEPAGSFRILLFHDVPKAERPAFAQLVQSLADAGRLITPAQAEARLNSAAPKGQGRPPCLISFDDGFASNLEVAETILAPLGAKALFFVCPGLTDLSGQAQADSIAANVFDGKRGANDLTILGWDGVERLMALGHSIGSHTLSHKRLTALSPDQCAEQIEGAAQAFQARLGAVPEWFAYTFGDVGSINPPSLAAIAARHRFCRSGVRGLNVPGMSPLALRADHVDLAAPPAWRQVAVEGGLDPLYRKARAALDGMARGL
ncbi:MAG: polysaccharide deacetylase family protein [Rhodospirillaceae bacterium]|nr:polysaccharide deacetylase family protein [Rhodospirillales bacterium]